MFLQTISFYIFYNPCFYLTIYTYFIIDFVSVLFEQHLHELGGAEGGME